MSRLRGAELADTAFVRRLENKGRRIVIARPGSEELRMLDYFAANANVNAEDFRQIIFREDVRTVEAIEEFLHGTQYRIPKLRLRFGTDTTFIESHVKQFMIRHRRLLRLSEEDVAIIRLMLGEI